jgi:hypothetical protein
MQTAEEESDIKKIKHLYLERTIKFRAVINLGSRAETGSHATNFKYCYGL